MRAEKTGKRLQAGETVAESFDPQRVSQLVIYLNPVSHSQIREGVFQVVELVGLHRLERRLVLHLLGEDVGGDDRAARLRVHDRGGLDLEPGAHHLPDTVRDVALVVDHVGVLWTKTLAQELALRLSHALALGQHAVKEGLALLLCSLECLFHRLAGLW